MARGGRIGRLRLAQTASSQPTRNNVPPSDGTNGAPAGIGLAALLSEASTVETGGLQGLGRESLDGATLRLGLSRSRPCAESAVAAGANQDWSTRVYPNGPMLLAWLIIGKTDPIWPRVKTRSRYRNKGVFVIQGEERI